MMRRLAAAILPAILAVPSATYAQCAMCGSAAASSPGVSRGLAYSIFFLLGTLALVVGWLVLLVWRVQSRSRREAAATGPEVPMPMTATGLPTGHAPAEK